MTAPVTVKRIAIAKQAGLWNVDAAAAACRAVGLPFFAACALLEKESSGKNIYGHDAGGINNVRGELRVTDVNFLAFLVKVMNGGTSNGVGPCQITYAGALKNGHRDGGFFRQMSEQGLRPWVPEDNMRFGFGLLKGYYDDTRSWVDAGTKFNGARTYGLDLDRRVQEWKTRLGIK